MSGDPVTPSINRKKRELTSPEFLIDLKKNRTTSSESDSDISDLSMMATMGATDGDGSAHLKLPKDDLLKIANILESSFKTQIAEMTKTIVECVLKGIQTNVETFTAENADLRERVESLEAKVNKLESSMENAELYSRHNCLRESGVPEHHPVSTADFVCTLAHAIGVDLNKDDIDRSHRLGKLPDDAEENARPRDIVVKFVSYRKRAQLYKARVKTKNNGYKGVYMNEHLTKVRAKILYEARRRVKSKQLQSAWFLDGTVFIKLNDADPDNNFDGTVKRVTTLTELPTYVPLPDKK